MFSLWIWAHRMIFSSHHSRKPWASEVCWIGWPKTGTCHLQFPHSVKCVAPECFWVWLSPMNLWELYNLPHEPFLKENSWNKITSYPQMHKHSKRANHLPVQLRSNESVDATPLATLTLTSIISVNGGEFSAITSTRKSEVLEEKWLNYNSKSESQGMLSYFPRKSLFEEDLSPDSHSHLPQPNWEVHLTCWTAEVMYKDLPQAGHVAYS